jgi:hypothetical protein
MRAAPRSSQHHATQRNATQRSATQRKAMQQTYQAFSDGAQVETGARLLRVGIQYRGPRLEEGNSKLNKEGECDQNLTGAV